MFEKFIPNKEDAAQKEAMKQQMEFQREQTTAETQAQDDQTYMWNQSEKSDLLRWQQELGDEMMECVQTLRGYAQDENGTWIQVRKEPLCNDKFIYDVIIPQCKPFTSRNLINSNLEEKRILKMLRYTMDDITNAMADGHDIYGMSFIDFDLILRTIKTTIIPSPFRALKGWTKRIDSTMSKRIEALNQNPQAQQKKGFLQSMFGG